MAGLPSGTITFLFTDLEGSTRLWENYADVMRVALVRHDAILRQAVEQNEGVLVKTTGDGIMAAFPTATDALNAALAAQQGLGAEVWPQPVVLKSRMGLHTGAAQYRDGDYFGPALNRAARLMAVGHGGQVLLSDVTQELCRDALPPGVTLRLLGEHRLKDLNRPETVFQLLHPSLAAAFPKLKSLDNPDLPNNLPLQLTSFIGREKEVAEVKSLLSKTRLLTLTGSGGCGKTRLSLQAAADVLEAYPDGVWMVELAPVSPLSDAALVVQTVAQALGVKEQPETPLLQTITERLKTKRTLIVLDNCEHLVSACALVADALLRHCPQVKILASSREGLGIAGELTYRVPSLSLPTRTGEATPQSLSQYEAVQLFIERAQFHQPDFAVTNRNAPALAALCHDLGGIPLALELAAARARALSVEEIAAKMGQRFRLLTGGSRAALPRQQTLRAAMDWSYDLLSEQEKIMLHRLSVFAGGWTLETAERVCSGDGIEEWETLDLLTSLADKSLAHFEDREGRGRYHLLETVRQYAGEKLAASGEAEATRQRHRDCFLALAEEAYEKRFTSEAPQLMERVERDHDNCRAALDFCAADSDSQLHLRLAGAMGWSWYARGYLQEGSARLNAALSRPDAQQITAPRALALNRAGILMIMRNDAVAARPLLEQSVEMWRALGAQQPLAIALNNLAFVERQERRYDQALVLLNEGLAVLRELNDRAGMPLLFNQIGNIARLQNDPVRARQSLDESVELSRETGNLFTLEEALGYLAEIAVQEGDYATARAQFREVLSIYAASRLEGSLIHSILEPVSELAVHIQAPRSGARLFAAAAALRDQRGMPVLSEVQPEYDRRERLLRAALDEPSFRAEWAIGYAFTWEEAIAQVEELLGTDPAPLLTPDS